MKPEEIRDLLHAHHLSSSFGVEKGRLIFKRDFYPVVTSHFEVNPRECRTIQELADQVVTVPLLSRLHQKMQETYLENLTPENWFQNLMVYMQYSSYRLPFLQYYGEELFETLDLSEVEREFRMLLTPGLQNMLTPKQRFREFNLHYIDSTCSTGSQGSSAYYTSHQYHRLS